MDETLRSGDTQTTGETQPKRDALEEVTIELRPLVKAFNELLNDLPEGTQKRRLIRLRDETIERTNRRRSAQSRQVAHLQAQLKAALEQLAALQEKPDDET